MFIPENAGYFPCRWGGKLRQQKYGFAGVQKNIMDEVCGQIRGFKGNVNEMRAFS